MEIIYPPYVLKRMIERGITVADVRDVLENGELIEEYKTDSRRVISCQDGAGKDRFMLSEKMTR